MTIYAVMFSARADTSMCLVLVMALGDLNAYA